jgi:hypothetical protein
VGLTQIQLNQYLCEHVIANLVVVAAHSFLAIPAPKIVTGFSQFSSYSALRASLHCTSTPYQHQATSFIRIKLNNNFKTH